MTNLKTFLFTIRMAFFCRVEIIEGYYYNYYSHFKTINEAKRRNYKIAYVKD